jgi:putative DNA primase/helicase
MSADPNKRMRRAALVYSERLNLPVFPCWWILSPGVCACPKGRNCGNSAGKHPRNRHGVHEATRDPAQIDRWWHDWPDANPAIACETFFVLDVDPRHGGDESLAALESAIGPLPTTWKCLTGGGGEHYYFQQIDGLSNTASDLGPGLDIRTRNGHVMGPPARHLCGRIYAWSTDHHPLDIPLAVAPDGLRARLLIHRPAGPDVVAGDGRSAISDDEWLALFSRPNEARHATLARLVGHLLAHRVNGYAALGIARMWNALHARPEPLPDEEIERTVRSIAKREIARREAWRREREASRKEGT